MKTKSNLVIILSIIGLLSCTKKQENAFGVCGKVEAKILRYDCDKVILSLSNKNPIGDAEWVDSLTNKTHSNVVFCPQTCQINDVAKGELTTVYLNLDDSNKKVNNSDCMQCQAISNNSPKTKVIIKSIHKKSCECKSSDNKKMKYENS